MLLVSLVQCALVQFFFPKSRCTLLIFSPLQLFVYEIGDNTHSAVVQKVVYGASAEAAVAVGLESNIADALMDDNFYEKVNLEIKKAQGSIAVIAEQVFENTKDKFVLP